MKATDLLEKQHRKVEKIFSKLEDQDGPEGSEELIEELANDLAAHMAIEQELFYPAVRDIDTDLVAESFEEHALAEVGLKRLVAASSDQTFKARVTALKELIEHHVKEEEKDLFPKVEKAMDEDKLDALGEQMEARFDEVVEAGFTSVVPKGVITSSGDVAQKRTKPKSRKKTQPARRKTAA